MILLCFRKKKHFKLLATPLIKYNQQHYETRNIKTTKLNPWLVPKTIIMRLHLLLFVHCLLFIWPPIGILITEYRCMRFNFISLCNMKNMLGNKYFFKNI